MFFCVQELLVCGLSDCTTSSRVVDTVFSSAPKECSSSPVAKQPQCLGSGMERGTSPALPPPPLLQTQHGHSHGEIGTRVPEKSLSRAIRVDCVSIDGVAIWVRLV